MFIAIIKKTRQKLNKVQDGFSFMEMIVSIGLFVIVVLSASQIFSMVMQGQQGTVASQNIQENVRYFFEVISKEVRMAQKSANDCESLFATPPIAVYKVYNVTQKNGSDALYFKNQYGECVTYYVSTDNKLMVKRAAGGEERTAATTPDSLIINDLNFTVEDDEIGTYHSTQPKITISIDASSENQPEQGVDERNMKLQTTISSRHYE